MNRSKFILFLLIVGFMVSNCQDNFLNRPPKDTVDAEDFFNTVRDLEVATNDFYSMLDPVNVYHDDSSTDNLLSGVPSDRMQGARIVPVARGSGGWSWGRLRRINFFLENYQQVDDDEAKAKYGGIARFFRAYFYFEKVKRFGDVPWYNEVLEAGDEGLYKPRDSRTMVIDSVFADINYAIDNIPAEIELNRITEYTALILKARIALHEGTFRKYHNLGEYEELLNEAVLTAEMLMDSGAYRLFTEGGEDEAYRGLFGRNNQDATETILAAEFERQVESHSTANRMISPTSGNWGIPKDMINSYLMDDGSRFTDQPNYEEMEFYEEMKNRDPRLTQTTAGPEFIVNGEDSREPVNLDISTTGYRVIKALPSRDQWGGGGSHFDIIVFRYAEALLIYAEAKAELGTLTQADLDMTINLLRDRVGMPHLTLADANADPDPYLENMYPNVDQGPNKGVILEIRRERRIEMFNEGLRWDDLMRWKEGKKVEQPLLGIYFSGLGAHDFNGDGVADVYLHDGNPSGAPSEVTSIVDINNKTLTEGTSGNFSAYSGGSFDENKDYYYPIPIEDLNLNPNLEQNTGWGE